MTRQRQVPALAVGVAVVAVAALMGLMLWFMPAGPASGQPAPVPTPTPTPAPVSGVYIDTEGMVRSRETEAKPNLALVRARAKAAQTRPANEPLTYVSIPRVLDQARELAKAGKSLPDDVRFLGGLTQLRYVFVYPAEQDLVIAGRAEPIDASNPLQPVGKITGRPVLQLDDLIVALRTIADPRGRGFFGCSIDPTCDMMKISTELGLKYGDKPAELKRRLAEAIGPQKVTVMGTAADTRLAFVMVAADFKMKRMSLGLEISPVAQVGNSLSNARSASNRFWFEPSYEPLLVSAGKDAYELRGKRLQVKAGGTMFDERGATEKAVKFAKAFTDNMPALAAGEPFFADLQNVSDLALLAALVQRDRLARKVGLDLTWAMESYPVAKVAVPRTCETLVNVTSVTAASGGVAMQFWPIVAELPRQQDDNGDVSAARQRPTEGWLLGPK